MAIQVQENGKTIYSTSSFSTPGNGPHTLCCWIQANTGTSWSGTVRSMVGLYSSANMVGVPGVLTGAASQIGTRGQGGVVDVWEWGGTIMVSSTSFTPPVGSWFHATFTYDGTTARLYINGLLNNSALFTKNPNFNYNMFFVNGYIYGFSNESSSFQTDEVMAFDRTLTDDEILTIYNTRGSRDGMVYGLLGRFAYEELYPGNNVVACYDDGPYLQATYPQSNGAIAQPGGSGWTNGAGFTITTNNTTAPDSTVTATRIVFTSLTNASTSVQPITTVAATEYTTSVYIKNNGSTGSITVQMGNSSGTISCFVTVNLSTFASSSPGTTSGVTRFTNVISPIPYGWYKISLAATFTSAGTSIGPRIVGAVTSGDFYVWNAYTYPTAVDATYVASTVSPSDVRMVQI